MYCVNVVVNLFVIDVRISVRQFLRRAFLSRRHRIKNSNHYEYSTHDSLAKLRLPPSIHLRRNPWDRVSLTYREIANEALKIQKKNGCDTQLHLIRRSLPRFMSANRVTGIPTLFTLDQGGQSEDTVSSLGAESRN
jgi:hypothetical protein